MQDLKKQPQLYNNQLRLKNRAMDFIAIGVGCNCLISLFETGVLQVLLNDEAIEIEEVGSYGDPLCIRSSLITLERCEIVIRKNEKFYITEFGKTLSDYLGLITIFFDGYAKLVSKQSEISKKKYINKHKLIKGESVSKASGLIGEKMIHPIIIKEMLEINFSGTICDLGCGYAAMLFKLCQATGNPGLGFDSEPRVAKQARKRLKNTNTTVELGDISNLQGIWEDVVTLVQCHVFHDFTPDQKCIDIMDSYLDNFPNMKCFFYIDTVAPSSVSNNIFPGFDYVHGLLGIPMRTYEETIKMFSKSKYKLAKEVPLELPNTFLWVLFPDKNKRKNG